LGVLVVVAIVIRQQQRNKYVRSLVRGRLEPYVSLFVEVLVVAEVALVSVLLRSLLPLRLAWI